jgi:hypothetical protein
VSVRQTRSGGVTWRRGGTSRNWFGIAIAVLFLVGWYWVAISRTAADWNIVAHGIRATGTVTTAGYCGGGDSEIGALVDYTDHSGVAREAYTQTCNGAYPRGSTIAFRYSPSEPTRLLTDDDVIHLREWTVGLFTFPLAMVGVGALFFWFIRRARRPA